MLYGEIEIGDILEWKTFGGQSTKLLVTGHGEIVKYGAKKGDDKKIIPAVYIRSLYAFDDDPELVEVTHLRQNCKRAPLEEEQQSGDGNEAATTEDSEGVDYETDDPIIDYDDEHSQVAESEYKSEHKSEHKIEYEKQPEYSEFVPLKKLENSTHNGGVIYDEKSGDGKKKLISSKTQIPRKS